MDNKERFDQIERLLAELLRKADRQDEFNTHVDKRLDGIDNRLDGIDNRLDGIDNRLDGIDNRLERIDNQLDGIVSVLKISAEAQRQAEERHEQVMQEIREQGRRTDRTQAEILRILDKMEGQQTQGDANTQQLGNHEPRIKRLEDEVFRAAS